MKEAPAHTAVREGYARVATEKTRCCGPAGGTTSWSAISAWISFNTSRLIVGTPCGSRREIRPDRHSPGARVSRDSAWSAPPSTSSKRP